jgi:RNA polymerase sigma-70 factor, ECF subfamily
MSFGELDALGRIGPARRAVSPLERLQQRAADIYEEHRLNIYRFLVAQGLPRATAQEVTQDVFVRFFMALRNGVEITSERGWIYTVAARSAADYWRQEHDHVWVGLETADQTSDRLRSQDPDPEVLAVRTQRLRRVAQTLLKLPAEQRLCVQLRSQGLRYRDIAGILGVAVSTTAEWLAIAVERLRGAAHD